MNFIRLGLYTALALVTYLMLLQWQEDYPQTIEQASGAEPTTQTQFPQIAQSDVPAVTSLEPAQASMSADVPTLPGQPTVAITNPAPETLVNITTSNFVLNINTVGGDIEYLALPKYLKALEPGADPFVILSNGDSQTYTAPSGLIGRDGIDSDNRARYSVAKTDYQLSAGQQTLDVDLTLTTDNGVEVIKRFSFAEDSYVIDVSYLINNRSDSEWRANAFGQIKRSNFDDPSNAGGFGRTYLGFVSTTLDDPYYEIEFDDIDDDGANTNTTTGGWMAFSQHYFISAWIANEQSQNNFTTRKNNAGQYFGEFTGEAITVPAGQTATYSTRFYAGPKDQYKLAEISENLDLTIDYSFLWFLAAPIYWLLTQINQFVGNYGFSIILLTVSVKALFYKLSETQYRSMAGMRRVMPKMQKLKENYGDDRVKMQQATMELYKKEKINPFGGCLPMLVQMPVFIALYWVLLESVELRHAPFMLWLTDLSVKDPYFILPLLMGGTMFLQTSLSPAPADPMQAKVMKLMPIMMTGIFLWFPAGLVLYWFTNAALGILQQWYITRKIEAQYEAKKELANLLPKSHVNHLTTDTIAALATAPGKSGICVVRVSGPNSGAVAKQILDFDPTPRTAHLSKFKDENGDIIDEGIALFFKGPASFTGEDVLELQGHGGPSVQKLLLERVLNLDVRLANPGEFSERAFLNNKIDLVQAEAIADLIDANSAQAARSAIRTLSGEFSNKVNHLVAELTKIRVNIEAAIDFSDEDIDIITESRVREGLREITQTLSLALSQANQGMLLKEGMHVVIAGEPNAGKSSLLNALLGSESAIVTSIAGTTRDLLSERLQIEGMPVHITDTAGLRRSDDVVEQEGIRRAGEAVRQSDRILLVIDSTAVEITLQQLVKTDEVNNHHELSLSLIPQLLLDEPGLFAKTLVVFNKADLTPGATIGAGTVRMPTLLKEQEGVPATLDTITLSAKLNEGIDGLREALKEAIGFNSMVEGAFVARERHLLSLKAARKLIASAEQCFVDAMPFELAAEDLRLAQHELGKITGQISSDDLLGEIFSNFCVGK